MIVIIALVCYLVGVLLLIQTGIWSERNPNDMRPVFSAVIGLCCVAGSLIMGSVEGSKEGQIDALQNKWEYEQQFVYRDTVLIDTIYVKIEK